MLPCQTSLPQHKHRPQPPGTCLQLINVKTLDILDSLHKPLHGCNFG